ncbi:MAG: CatB-related O-acetyltransferase [Rhizobiaceae bacterium]|nr:CatB-related O-acetyltransferase [Rhizobiaceae bacterium]
MTLPDPKIRNPLVFPDGSHDKSTVFLNQVIKHPNIEIGDFTYYNDASQPEDYAARLAPYLFPGAPEHLKIGKFCQIAQGVQIITATANHPMEGISTYPFAVFDPPRFPTYRETLPRGEDTVIGNDCWIGREAMLMPGAKLGNGVIVGARSVVNGTIPDYAIIAGNPAKIVRMRFSDDEIAELIRICWWNWDNEKISSAIEAIERADIDTLSTI